MLHPRRLYVVKANSAAEPLPGTGVAHGQFPPHTTVYEEIYTWTPPFDVWSCFARKIDKDRVSQQLIHGHITDAPSDQGTMEELQKVVDELRRIVATPESSSWVPTTDEGFSGADDDSELEAQCNGVFALLHQLEWIWATFRHLPNCVVTIR